MSRIENGACRIEVEGDYELLLWQRDDGWIVTLFAMGAEQESYAFPNREQAMGGLSVLDRRYPFARLTL